MNFDPPLDVGVREIVEALVGRNIETFESCEGGAGHAYAEPTIRFHGGLAEGLRALSVAIEERLPVRTLRRVWVILDEEPTGPYWEMTFGQGGES